MRDARSPSASVPKRRFDNKLLVLSIPWKTSSVLLQALNVTSDRKRSYLTILSGLDFAVG